MALEVRPVTTRRDLRTFIKLPWRLYRQEPNWVAPLLMDVKKRLDRKKNPFFKHAEAQYFLAYRDGRPVGRISAHIDQNFNSFHGNEWGLFGFFECEDDAEAAHALADAAEGWLRERGRDRMVGPMDFTTNDEIGLLITGHEYPPIILCPWHHPYYQRIFEQGGCPGRRGTLMMAARVNLSDGDERSGLLGDVCGGGLCDLAFDGEGELGEAVVADDPSELSLGLEHPGGSPA